MCEALKELMKDELDAARENGLQRGICQGQEIGMRQGQEIGMRQGQEIGMRQGQEIATDRLNILTKQLIQLNRTDDLLRSTTDKEYQEQLFKEFGIE